jgi:2-methylisocitrate lyase-like PEP mutase family enzyme
MKKTTRLQELFHQAEPFSIVGGQGALMARMIELAGFECAYIGGGFTSGVVYGMPDMALITRTELVANAGIMANAIDIPLIADADDAYGGPMAVRRTVHEFIRAGVAGIHIEDQLPARKRSGSMPGKGIIPLADAVNKYRAAVDAKNELDPDFVVIARCEARGVEGGSVEHVVERMRAYKATGVDVLYAEFLETRSEIEAVRSQVEGPMMGTNHRIDPPLSLADLKDIGYAADFWPAEVTWAAMQGAWDFAHELRTGGAEAAAKFRSRETVHPMPSFHELNGFNAGQEWEARYLDDVAAEQTAPTHGYAEERRA